MERAKIFVIFILIFIGLFSCSKKEEKSVTINVVDDKNIVENEDIVEDENIIIVKDIDKINYVPDYTKNGAVIGVINSGGKTWTIRYLIGICSLSGWREDIIDILDNPRGNVLYRVRRKPNKDALYSVVNILAITKETDTVEGIYYEDENFKLSEDHWVKILIDDDKSGWVFGLKLDIERGGPKYLTPENVEDFLNEFKEFISEKDEDNYFKKFYIKENVMR